jgi:hypothetical protein
MLGYDPETGYDVYGTTYESCFGSMLTELLEAKLIRFSALVDGLEASSFLDGLSTNPYNNTSYEEIYKLENCIYLEPDYNYGNMDRRYKVYLFPPKSVVSLVSEVSGEAGLGNYDTLPAKITISIYK